jgi:UDP-N-acetylmuramate dehydrogenase
VDLAELTTLRLGGPARSVLEVTTESEFVDAVRIADEAGDPVLVVAGGSNLVVADEGFDGTVIVVRTTGVEVNDDACGGLAVTVQAGESWDDLVARAVESGWLGIEALSGIPGSCGATPIQNVGAYGQEVGQTIASVRTFDRYERTFRTFPAAACDFGYRSSVFKRDAPRYTVLSVTFQFRRGDLGLPIGYRQLADALDVDVGARVPTADVRAAVLDLRRSKGMVLDPTDHDTWSAGSFFTNPVLHEGSASSLPDDAPSYPQADGSVKTSAAWLIEHAGFERGHLGPAGRVSLSTKHTLALTNRGNGTTDDLLGLAREVTKGVRERFGVELTPEPTLVGCQL